MEKERHEKKRNNKSDSDTDSDRGENLRNFVAFTTLDLSSDKKSAAGSVSSSVLESTRGGDDVVRSDDDAGSFDDVDLAKNYETFEALKHASEKEEKATQAIVQLEETQKGLRMLINGTDQLDHLLSIGQSDRCGLGFKGESSKGGCVFVYAGATENVATCATKPVAKVFQTVKGEATYGANIWLMNTWPGRSDYYGDGRM
ncbi:hypothetical protein F2Q70_00010852 [Brassica cretica]|uniref:Uncharacterized protein n=1 Tax=Brassica cretica TaxID=69181 RepID=A0A8S9M289_BRACR|nr:hypothetical protein F2Q70_00010852 [Brassica cretica]